MMGTVISDDQWQRVQPLLPDPKPTGRPGPMISAPCLPSGKYRLITGEILRYYVPQNDKNQITVTDHWRVLQNDRYMRSMGLYEVLVSSIDYSFYWIFSLTGWAFTSLPYFSLNDVKVTGRVILQGRDEGNFGDITIRVLEDEATVRTLTTSANGSFAFNMKPETYRLEIIKAGWQTQTRQIVISRDHVDLRPMKLLLAGKDTCPGAITGLEEAPQITGVISVMAPNNSLIFDFNVEVDKPARVWVEYYPVADSSIITKTPLTEDSNTNHELQVMRLRPDTTYCYQVFATSSTPGTVSIASDSFPGSFTTGPLPPGLAGASFQHVSGQQTYDLTLFDFNDTDFNGFIAIDRNADVVWYYQHALPTFAVAQGDDHHLIFGEYEGPKFIEIRYSTTVIHVLQRRGACTLELSNWNWASPPWKLAKSGSTDIARTGLPHVVPGPRG